MSAVPGTGEYMQAEDEVTLKGGYSVKPFPTVHTVCSTPAVPPGHPCFPLLIVVVMNTCQVHHVIITCQVAHVFTKIMNTWGTWHG
jgi:hypothetical protein